MVSSPGLYSAMTVMALFAVTALSMQQARAQQLSRCQLLLCLVLAAIASFPGARIWYLSTHRGNLTFQRLLDFQPHGLSMLGGGLSAGAAGVVACRFQRLPLRKAADTVTPGVLVATALMKLGCFFRGCCFGRPTELSWGVRFPVESPATLRQLEIAPWSILTGPAPIHPLQLYEFLAYLTFAALLLWMPKRLPLGIRACLGLAAMSVIHGSCLLMRDIPTASRFAMEAGLVADLLVLSLSVPAFIHCWRHDCSYTSSSSLDNFRKTLRQH